MRVSTPWRSMRVLSWASTTSVSPRSTQPSPRRSRRASQLVSTQPSPHRSRRASQLVSTQPSPHRSRRTSQLERRPLPRGERGVRWWAHLDSNQDRTGYEPGALPIELWARGWQSWHRSRLEEAPELLGPRGMAELAEGLGLYLANALTGDREVLPHFLEGVLAAVGEPEAEPQHLLLARGERVQHLVGLLAQREPDHALHGRAHLLVLDEVAQVAVLFLADGRLEGDGLLRDLEDLAHLVHRHFHLHRDLFGARLAPELLHQLPRGADQLVDGLDHVHGDADGAGLVGDGAGDGLADPPRGVRGELVAAPVLELVHGLHETDVAFLDQVEELEAAVRVLLGDGDDEAKVGLYHLLLGAGGLDLARADVLHDTLQIVGPRLRVLLGPLDLLLGDPDEALLDRGMPRRRLLVEIAVAVLAVLGERVQERVDLRRGRTLAVGPERDLALGHLDLLDELLEVLTPLIEEGRLEAQGAEGLKGFGLLGVGGNLVLLPRRLALSLLAPARLGAKLPGLL